VRSDRLRDDGLADDALRVVTGPNSRAQNEEGKQILRAAFIIFDKLTALDFIGIYDPLSRLKTMRTLPDFEWRICARTREVMDDRGLRFVAECVKEPLDRYDMVVVPGGFGTRELVHDPEFIEWLRTCEPCKLKVSVCTGALLLGAAGFLKDKRATTHPNAFRELEPFCRSVLDARIVDERDVITARGVSSAIDLGLYLVEKLAGADARMQIAKQMDYPYLSTSVHIERSNA
jgi:transcriptional regulator GlxA family with amidase domain